MKEIERIFSHVINAVTSISGNAAIIFLVAAVLLINVSVVTRYALSAPLHFVEEISGYFVVAIVFLGLADTLRAERHIRIDVVFIHLSKKIQNTLEILSFILGLIFTGVFAWLTWQTVLDSYQIGMTSEGLWEVPLYLPQLLMPIGLVILILQILAYSIRKMHSFRS